MIKKIIKIIKKIWRLIKLAITKRNEYLPEQDLTNLSINVDDNRLGNDQTEITVNFGTTPATVTVKVGSVIEVNGNSYVVDTADEVFQMTSDTDNYITFTDNPSTAFGSSSAKGAFDAQKQGFYQAGNLIRTLKWYIDQTTEEFFVYHDILSLMDHPAKFDEVLITDLNVVNTDADNIDVDNLDVTGTLNVGGGKEIVEIVERTGAYTGTATTLSYPSGFNQSNTRIIACEVLASGVAHGQGSSSVAGRLEATLIRIVSSGLNGSYRLVLMR